jgi:exodeoxyribonuclease VII large subunit
MTQLDFDSLLRDKSSYSVSELTREIKQLLEFEYPDIRVQGEISNFTHHNSGHMYFSLKDEHAQISCVMWRSQNYRLRFVPQDGLKIIVDARVAVYEKRGVYQLDILQMQPAGIGELQFAFEQLKNRLQQEGLFDSARKKPLPVFPQRIGIITSSTGAAIRDFLSVISRRFPAADVVLSPVRVQGEGAALEIARAVDDFNAYGKVDLLVVTRGGGSLEDLWAFNEESVARAIYRSEIPVVSAVGHEIDFSISDFVADSRAPTPSAAAEIIVPDRSSLLHNIAKMHQGMLAAVYLRIHRQREKLNALSRTYAFRQPADMVHQNYQRLDELRRRIHSSVRYNLDIRKSSLANLGGRLQLLSHENILQRGYTLCRDSRTGKLVKRVAEVKVNDKLALQFYDGVAGSRVEKITTERE